MRYVWGKNESALHDCLKTSLPSASRYAIVACLLFLGLNAAAQTTYRIEKYNTKNGLKHHWVRGVQQDEQGFIWLALKDGMIARFDGRSFRHFPMNEAEKAQFGGNVIYALMIDEKGRFVVLVNNKVARFEPANGRYIPMDSTGADYPGLVAYWEAKNKANPWDKNWKQLNHPSRLVRLGSADTLHLGETNEVFEVLETGSEYWVATFDGLLKFTPRQRLFDAYLSKPFNPQDGLVTGRSIYGIAESKGWLFFIEKGLWRAPLGQPERAEQVVDPVWLNGFFGLTADAEGWLWAGRSYSETVMRIHPDDPARVQEFALPPAFFTQKRSFLPLSDGRVMVACEAGLLLVDPARNAVQPFETGAIKNAWCLHLTQQGDVWVGTETGLWRMSPQGTGYKAVEQFSTENCKGFGSNKIISIHEAEGHLWLGSDGGLIRFRISDSESRDGEAQSEIRNPKSEIAKTFTVADGLPNNRVYCAMPDGKYLWCPTDGGLARITLATVLKTNELPEIRNFHVDEGLPHEEFNSLSFYKSPSSSKIYFGGLNGMTVFSPQSLLLPQRSAPPLVLMELEKFDSKHDTTLVFDLSGVQTGPIVFEHYDQYFTLRFALLSFANPGRNSYQYMLEGFEKKWNPVSYDNFARYTALPPGRYTFRVRAADHNGNWSRGEISLPIIVKRAWYATWWAWAIYLLAAGGLVFFFYEQRLRQVRLAAKAQHLEELDAFKSRFFTNITHEFRTPLTVLLGNLEIMKLEIERQPAQLSISQFLIAKISMTRRNAESLLRLINQILDLAKLEDKSLKMNYVRGDVVPYLRYIAESLHSLANAQNVVVKVENTEAKIEMDYDPERLLQIVYNLLSNAIKFTPGGGKVTLSIGMRDEASVMNGHTVSSLITPPSSLVLSVSDTGVGIPSEDLANIFDRFYQAENQALTKKGGTGIGLSLTKELVKAMGGVINVASVVGKGTTFTVRLPLEQSPLTAKGEPYPSSSVNFPPVKPSTELPDLGPKAHSNETNPSILLIEDNPDVVEYLAACLKERYSIAFAYNGRAGIEKALETVPDLIISDVMMPEKDGFEVCETLKNDERTSHVPIILLTAKADVESRIAGLKRGADAYLAKPFNQEELLVTVANLLETRRKLQARFRQLAVGGQQQAAPQSRGVGTSSEIRNPKSDIEAAFLQKLRTAIEPRLGDADLNAEEICRQIGMSRSVLYAKLSALTGLSFNLYLRSLRLRKAQEMLLSHAEMNVSEVAYEVGFNDPRYFMRVFAEEFGMPPGEWRKQA
ncbi:MAG: response regulator [Saprospiraceae bacterium]|nr:response regulator [Saprospiraceae bacterium]